MSEDPSNAIPTGLRVSLAFLLTVLTVEASGESATERLAKELRGRGWIVFSAATDQGDLDLFLTRPDGSDRRKITDTRGFHEAGARFSPDGKRLLYYRMPTTVAVGNNNYGTHELVVANSDGSSPVVLGGNFWWASWGPDGTKLACLAKSGIQIVDLESRKVVRQIPRQGIVQQLVWSPNGRWFAGTANGLGVYWNIGRLDTESGKINCVSETERYNCTPDWMPDSRRIIYSRGIVPEAGGYAELWVASGDGKNKRVLCAEGSRHLYGGCASPDGKYVLFTRSEVDLGKVKNSRTRMAIIRWTDTPIVLGPDESLGKRYPNAGHGPVLDLSWGWEPHWTFADIEVARAPSE